jgi:hypothetical protein
LNQHKSQGFVWNLLAFSNSLQKVKADFFMFKTLKPPIPKCMHEKCMNNMYILQGFYDPYTEEASVNIYNSTFTAH